MADALEVVPGWYGKLPCLGDFASRRLSQPFIAAWDDWLQLSMTASRAQLGAQWLDTYLHSPIWRFALLPGVIGSSFWAGLIMPSVDKVGRHFPLTIAVPLEPRPGVFAAVMAAHNWYIELEEVALATLNVDFPLDRFEAELADLPFEDGPVQQSDPNAVRLANWWQQRSGELQIALPAGYTPHHLVCAAAAELLQVSGGGKSLWWQASANADQSRFACFTALPHPEHYGSLLRGQAVAASLATPGAARASGRPPQLDTA